MTERRVIAYNSACTFAIHVGHYFFSIYIAVYVCSIYLGIEKKYLGVVKKL